MIVQKQPDFEIGQPVLLQQKLEFDRYRTAIELVRLMREDVVANYLLISQTATDATAFT